MIQLDDVRRLARTFFGLAVFDAGDGEEWAVGDEGETHSAVGRGVIEALQHLDDAGAAALAPILGEHLIGLARAAADPDGRTAGLFLYRVR